MFIHVLSEIFSYMVSNSQKANLVFPCTHCEYMADAKSGLVWQHLADSTATFSLDGVVFSPCVSGFNK